MILNAVAFEVSPALPERYTWQQCPSSAHSRKQTIHDTGVLGSNHGSNPAMTPHSFSATVTHHDFDRILVTVSSTMEV